MQHPTLRFAALTASAATLVLAVAGATLRTIGPATPQTFNISSPLIFWIAGAGAAIYALVGLLLARRLPSHPVPWIFLGVGLAWSGVMLTWAYVTVASSHHPPLEGAGLVALINTAVLQPIGLGLAVLLLHVFPDGRPVDLASRHSALLTPVPVVLVSLGVAISPGSVGIYTGLANPLDPQIPIAVGWLVNVIGVAGIVGLAVMGYRSLWVRYSTGDRIVRAQIRWFLWAGGLGACVAIGIVGILTVNRAILSGPGEGVVLVLFSAAAALVPIACAIAILRHGLYDIDRLISRTFVYIALLAIVAGTYSAGMRVLDRLVIAVTGQPSDLVAVLTTLILAISFEPLKVRLTKFAEKFDEEPEATPSELPIPDDWIDTVAARVIERLEAGRATLSQADGVESPPRLRRPFRPRPLER